MDVILSPSSATLAQFSLQLTVDSRHSGRATRSACAVDHDLMVIPLNVDPPESAIIRAEGGGHTHCLDFLHRVWTRKHKHKKTLTSNTTSRARDQSGRQSPLLTLQ